MKQTTVKTNDTLKNFILDYIINTLLSSDTKTERERAKKELENNIKVLIMDSAEAVPEVPSIGGQVYYSEQDNIGIRKILDGLRDGIIKLEDIKAFENIKPRKSFTAQGKGIIVHCLLLNGAVAYEGIIKYMLNVISDKAVMINEVLEKSEIDNVFDEFESEFENCAIFMEKYTRKLLNENGFPNAELIIELSARRYEGSESEARIYIDGGELQKEDRICTFDHYGYEQRELNSRNLRTIRKLMEISKRRTLSLLADNSLHIIGLTSLRESNDQNFNKNSKCICFNGYMNWSIYQGKKEVICYRQGRYIVNSSDSTDIDKIAVETFKSEYHELLENGTLTVIEQLADILIKQKHGTSVILTDDDNEAGRLCKMNRGILVSKADKQNFRTVGDKFDEEKLLSITQIDGALFMELNGTCSACGVIVDGVAEYQGDSSRGARYNSIYNYIKQKSAEKKYIAMIFSEDGGIDIVCNLES